MKKAVLMLIMLVISLVMFGCSESTQKDNKIQMMSLEESNVNVNVANPTADDVLQALLDPNMVYTDDRFHFGEDAYRITTQYLKCHEPDYDDANIGKKWQLPEGYVLEIAEDRSAYLTTFPIGGRQKKSDPTEFETRPLWSNIDTGEIHNPSSKMQAIYDRKATFTMEYSLDKSSFEVVVWQWGEQIEKLPISDIDTYNKTRLVDYTSGNGYFVFGTSDMEYSDYHEGVFFENANELYLCYELNGEYKSKMIADDYTVFVSCASSIFYIDEQANLVQLDVYGNVERIEKSIIATNVYALNETGEFRKIGDNDWHCPEHYILQNKARPFGSGL